MNARAIAAVAVTAFMGCGSGTGKVTGTIIFMGQPLPSGSVTLIAADGQRFDTALTTEGKFTIDAVPIGRAKLAVQSHPRVPPLLLGKDRFTAAGKEAAKFVPIPERYASPDDSGLFVEVKAGEQACRLELKGE